MLISKEVEVYLTNNVKYYEDLDYQIPRSFSNKTKKWVVKTGTLIRVKVNDLPIGSTIFVDVECDYCGKIVPKKYHKYLKQKKDGGKDCCYECRNLKNKDSMNIKYGVEWNSQLNSVKEKISQANREDELIVKQCFEKAGYIMLDKYKSYSKPIRFICEKHKEEGIQTTTYYIVKHYNSGCHYCRYKKTTGENCHLWKGGITSLSGYLRGKIYKWKFDSLKENNFKCILTGINDGSLVIHHLYSFSEIVNITLEETGITLYPEVSLYNDNELKILEDKCLEIHYRLGMGIPMLKSLHNIFHAQMGDLIIDNGEFNNFINRYYNFEFNAMLDSKYKFCVS